MRWMRAKVTAAQTVNPGGQLARAEFRLIKRSSSPGTRVTGARRTRAHRPYHGAHPDCCEGDRLSVVH